MVDECGLLLAVKVHPANEAERKTIHDVMAEACLAVPTLKKVYLDAGYSGPDAERLAEERGLDVVVSQSAQDRVYGLWTLINPQQPAEPLPAKPLATEPQQPVQKVRWVVERSFGWLGRNRRLSKDYEANPQTTEFWIWAAMLQLLLHRIGENPPSSQPS